MPKDTTEATTPQAPQSTRAQLSAPRDHLPSYAQERQQTRDDHIKAACGIVRAVLTADLVEGLISGEIDAKQLEKTECK